MKTIEHASIRPERSMTRWHASAPRRFLFRVIIKVRVELERMAGPSIALKRLIARPAHDNLSWLAAVYGSDKGVSAHRYVDLYDRHLGTRRDSVTKVLEIGVYRGASLLMWRDYFPNAEVYGLDIEDMATVSGPRIHLLRGDQSDPELLAGLRTLGPFDLIIDDGSHRADDVVVTFNGLFDAVVPGGQYVIEDMHTAYDDEYGGGVPGRPGTSAELVRGFVDAVNREFFAESCPYLAAEAPPIAALHVYPKIAFLERGE